MIDVNYLWSTTRFTYRSLSLQHTIIYYFTSACCCCCFYGFCCNMISLMILMHIKMIELYVHV